MSKTADKTRRAIILLTDGQDTSSQKKFDEAVDQAVKADTTIYAIGIGDRYYDGVNEGVLNKMAQRTGGRAYFPRNEEALHKAFSQIEEELRSQYLVAYAPTNKKRDSTFRKISIELANPELENEKIKLGYRQGYFAKGSTPNAPTSKRD